MSEMPPPTEPGEPTPAYGAYGAPETLATEPAKTRRGVVIGVGATVLAVAAGAAVWATTTLSGGGMQPEEVVPKTTFAYVKIDLDPAANQKLAARSFFSKFPQLKDKVGVDTDDVFDNLLAEAVHDETLDYRTDVQPWFDKRAAVAAFTEGTKTHVVAALRSKDDEQAKASLDKALAKAKAGGDDSVAYRLTKGYAIIGDTDGVAAAVDLAANESLRDNETYRADVDRLDGDQVSVGWADIAKAFAGIREQLPSAVAIPATLSGQVKGRVVAGLHLTGDTAEVQGLLLGTDLPTPQPGQDLLTGLPANTAAALSVNGLGKTLGGENAVPLDLLLRDYLEGTGLTIGGDVLPLLGKQTVLAAAPFAGLEDLQAGLVSKVDDPATAATTAAKIQAALQAFGVPVSADVTGDTFVLAVPQTYGNELAKGGGGLGAEPGFTKAMGDLGDVTSAFYLDVSALRGMWPFTGAPDGMTFGMVSGTRGGDGFFRVRLVVG